MFLLKVAIIAILSFLATMFLPWYSVCIIAFLTGLILSNLPGNNFLAGFFGVGIFWLSYSLFLDTRNEHILSTKIVALFSEKLSFKLLFIEILLATTFLGALLGALSCMAGALIMDDGSRMRRKKALKSSNYKLKIK